MRAPASQFYWGDLRRDTEYHLMKWASRGVWIEMLSCMHFSKERGKLKGTPEQLSRLIGCTVEQFQKAKTDISVTKTGDVTESNGTVTIINRRMFREERERILTRSRVQQFRNATKKRSCNEEVTPSSSSPILQSPKKHHTPNGFERFWSVFPKKLAKGKAEIAFKKVNPDEKLLAQILASIERGKRSPEWMKDEGKYIPYPATWLSGKRWLDEYPEEVRPEVESSPPLVELDGKVVDAREYL